METQALIKKANELGFAYIAFASKGRPGFKGHYTVYETRPDRAHGLDSRVLKCNFKSEFPEGTILADKIEL